MATADEHLKELLKLPVEERARIVKLLLERLDLDADDPNAESLRSAELDRRVRAVSEGSAELVESDEVRRRVESRLQAVREE